MSQYFHFLPILSATRLSVFLLFLVILVPRFALNRLEELVYVCKKTAFFEAPEARGP
jgi:hypothetical protein